jgi:hypothetical protein
VQDIGEHLERGIGVRGSPFGDRNIGPEVHNRIVA